MKAEYLATAALCVHVGLAMPRGKYNHNRFHDKRAVTTTYSTLTEVVTVTDYNAVVWVDSAGHVVKTEHKTPVTTSSSSISTSSPPTSSPMTSVSTTSSSIASTKVSSSESAVAPVGQVGSKQADRIGVGLTTTENPPASTTATATQSPSPSPSPSPKANKDANTAATTNNVGNIAGFGVAYDAFTGSGCRSSLDGDFAFLASQGANMIRVYDGCFAESINAAVAHNIKLMIGITTFSDFDNHMDQLVRSVTGTSAGWSVVDTVFIGNELVDKHMASSSEVAAKVSVARGILKTRGFSGNVVTVDTWTQMRSDATICSTSDYCAANAHAFFDGNTRAQDAGKFVRGAQKAVADKNSGKRVVITESGWPHAGDTVGVAVPGVDTQRAAIGSIVKEFSSNAGDMFLFMAYDTKYKTNAAEIERNFGIFDSDHYDGSF